MTQLAPDSGLMNLPQSRQRITQPINPSNEHNSTPTLKTRQANYSLQFTFYSGMIFGMGALKSKRCSRGHLLKDGNLYIRSNGTRECRKCSLVRSKEWVAAQRKK